MYAVVETGGKQYKVIVGDRLKVEKLSVAEGSVIDLERVLMVSDGEHATVGAPVVEIPVTATVLSHGKRNKIKVFKMKRRKNYRRTQGHRQLFTEIQITRIGDEEAALQDTVLVESTLPQEENMLQLASLPESVEEVAKEAAEPVTTESDSNAVEQATESDKH